MIGNRFVPGDVVQSTVGGRKMMVDRYDAYGYVVCRWVDPTQELQEATFNEAVLRKVAVVVEDRWSLP